jgi:serine phosphatase RsbU (regulator of sigma subunit)/CHASE3 domain sensor protein
LSVRRRVQLLLLGFLVLIVVDGIFAVLGVIERDHAHEDLAGGQGRAREVTNRLLASFADQETGFLGFVETGDEKFLGTYRAGRRAAERQLTTLRVLFAGEPRLLAATDRVAASWRRWSGQAARPDIRALRGTPSGRAARLAYGGRAHRLFEDLRDDMARLRTASARASQRSRVRFDRAAGRLTTVLLVSVVAAAALTVAAAVLLQRWLGTPLRGLSAAVRRVAAGSLDERIPSEGPSDLAALGRDVERMRRRILTELENAVRAREALQQQGLAVLTLRSQLDPSHDGLPPPMALSASFSPAQGVLAGDWYDVVELGDGHFLLAVVDVSGHGPVAGVLALRIKQLLVAVGREGLSPGETLTWLASQLGETGESFATCVLMEVDGPRGRCRHANAGHPPAIVVADGRPRQLDPTGPLLGPFEASWGTTEVALDDVELLFAYTDGLVEARDAQGREFGVTRVLDLVARHRRAGPDGVVQACVDAVHAFHPGRLTDDLTIVALAPDTRRVAGSRAEGAVPEGGTAPGAARRGSRPTAPGPPGAE